MNALLLKILRKTSVPLPMETMATALETSPQTLTRLLSDLSEKGYLFKESKDGIQLIQSPDIPFPWEFPSRELTIHYYQEIDSTMTVARRLAHSNAPDFTVVVAETQTKGRGRLERQWSSSMGGLYFTMILRPRMESSDSFLINFLASLVLSQVLNDLFQINAMVKWPNDILVDEKKVAGMISEMGATGNHIDYVNLGIGVNVNNDPQLAFPNAASIRNILGKPVSRVILLSTFIEALDLKMKQEPLDPRIIAQWKKNSMTLGREVTIATMHECFSGKAVDVDNQGALLLKTPDGDVKRIIYGDCFLRD